MHHEVTISGGGLQKALTVKFSVNHSGNNPPPKVPEKKSVKVLPNKPDKLHMAMLKMIQNNQNSGPKDKNGIPYVKPTTEPYH